MPLLPVPKLVPELPALVGFDVLPAVCVPVAPPLVDVVAAPFPLQYPSYHVLIAVKSDAEQVLEAILPQTCATPAVPLMVSKG